MARTAKDITEAELSVLQALWDAGPATIRQLAANVYERVDASRYATVQKLLDRLEAKGCVRRERLEGGHLFHPAIDRDELIGRRLRAVADKLCGGSLTPLLTHLVQARPLTEQDRLMLRSLIDDHRSSN